MKETYSNLSKDSRKAVREFAKFYQEPSSPLMGWLLKNDKGEYHTRYEAQGKTELITDDKIIASCGKAYEQGGSNLKVCYKKPQNRRAMF